MIEIGIFMLCIGAAVAAAIPVALICFATIIAAYIWTRSLKGVIVGIILALLCIGGALYSHYHARSIMHAPLGIQTIALTVKSVDRRLEDMRFVGEAENGALVQVYTDDKTLLPGDRVTAMGTVDVPKDFVTGTGRTFGYERYMQSKSITGVMYRAAVVHISEGQWSVARTATKIRFAIAELFAIYITFPADGVASGMLVGYQGGIPDSVSSLFRDTGVLHVLVLSGYNITLLAGFLALLLKPLPYRLRLAVTGLVIIVLVLISGSGIASVRAGIMGSIALLAGFTLRTYQPVRALAVAILVFFILSPATLFVDPGFQLSALATFYMIAVLPKVEHLFHFIPSTKYVDIRELLVLALTIPVFMLPYTMYFSGIAPLATIPANIVLAVVTTTVMILGALIIATAWMPPVAGMIGAVTGSFIMAVVWLLERFAHLPIWNTPALSGWCITGIYAVLIGYLFRTELTSFARQLRNSLARQTS